MRNSANADGSDGTADQTAAADEIIQASGIEPNTQVRVWLGDDQKAEYIQVINPSFGPRPDTN